MADSSSSQPLYEKVSHHSFFVRSVDLTILALLSSLLIYRILYINTYDAVWTLAFLCESCFSFVWFLVTVMKWSPAEYKTYPDRLDASVHELPPVDMFVTTADPVMEPPILTVNTVLSLLAVNYPANKLTCYVSDDGCSPITYFSLKETSKFAKIWVPFCKRYNVQVRAPFRYFLNPRVNPEGSDSVQFGQDWETMKMEYEKLCRKLEVVSENSDWLDADDDFAAFSNINPRDHSTIVKVIWENKGGVGHYKEVPHLVYIAREKNPKHPHHYKAGAMNVLARVSGLMTNAPYMLNVDCDMYANNPEVLKQAMCLFLGSNNQSEYAFVQSPQSFYDSFCDELIVLQTYLGGGINGIHGPFYAGTGGIHRRRVIYGLSPEDLEDDGNLSYIAKGKLLGEDKLEREFGVCNEMVKSAVEALQGKTNSHITLTTSLEAAHRVADCAYEYSTSWGKTIGWLYDSTAEDINTSINIHSKGWKSFYNSPDPPAFLGSMPAGGPEVLGQQRRWAAGLLEVLFNKQSPVIGILYRKLGFRPGVCYLYVLMWGLRSIPELCYSLLPAYCILHNSVFLPKGPCLCIVIALVVMYCLYTLWQYINIALSIRSWFGSLLFARIKTTCAWLFSIPDIIFKFLGISNMVFILSKKTAPATSRQKDSEADSDGEKFVFDDSIYFLPGTTILLVNLLALVGYLGGLWSPSDSDNGGGSGVGEVFGCVCVVVSFWLFLMGLFEKGKYGIPMSTISKASVLALFFVVFSLRRL